MDSTFTACVRDVLDGGENQPMPKWRIRDARKARAKAIGSLTQDERSIIFGLEIVMTGCRHDGKFYLTPDGFLGVEFKGNE